MTTSKYYMFNGTQVVLFLDENKAKNLGLNIIETDTFSHAAVKYDDIKDRDDVTEDMLYVPYDNVKEGDEIVLSDDAMDDLFECPECRFCTKAWAKLCHAYFEFSYENNRPYRGSQLERLFDDIKYFTRRNDYFVLESLRDEYNTEMHKHLKDGVAPDTLVNFNAAFKNVIGESFDEWKQRVTEFEAWWDADESITGDDADRSYELADNAIIGESYDDPEAHLNYGLIRYMKRKYTEAELMEFSKNKVEEVADTSDSEAVKAFAARIFYKTIFCAHKQEL